MKMTIKNITMLLGAAALLLTSCQEKERLVDVSGGEAVQFSIGTKGSELSKAVYAGNTETPGGVENIYWKKGDMLRLYSEQAIASYTDDTKHHADYKVLEDTDAEKKWAPLIQADPTDMGLRYKSGEVTYTFYGMHPSPLAGGIGTGITENVVTANLASEQGFDSATNDGSGNWTVTPDLKWMLMTTKTSIAVSEIPAEGVSLVFTPLTTAVKFTVTNDTEGEMPIKKVMLISKESAISGEFSVDIYPDNTVTKGATTGTEVSIDLRSQNISLAKGKSLTFTFFLAPTKDNIDDLTFRFYKTETAWMQTRLGYTDGSGIEFPKSKKTIVKGVMLPDGAQWTVKYAPDVDPWYPGGGDPDFKPEVSGDPIVTSWDTGIDADLELSDASVKWIDLGLPSGTLWANMNVGAKSETEIGDYFAWGETEPWYESISGTTLTMKSDYSDGYTSTTYGEMSNMKSILHNLTGEYLQYDVAFNKFGDGYRMPSYNDFKELWDNTNQTYETVDGVFCRKFTNKNDATKYIYLPFGGQCTTKAIENNNMKACYWSSTNNEGQAYFLEIETTTAGDVFHWQPRFHGCNVRAVKDVHKSVKIGDVYWATTNIGADTPKDYGWYFSWGGTTGYVYKNSAWVNAKTGAADYIFSWDAYNATDASNLSSDITPNSGYDAARVNWGGDWRMPTKAESQALYNSTYWKWDDTDSGYYVYMPKNENDKGHFYGEQYFTPTGSYSKEEAVLFFPATYFGDGSSMSGTRYDGLYWLSTYYGIWGGDNKKHAYYFNFHEASYILPQNNTMVMAGFPIRPVKDAD